MPDHDQLIIDLVLWVKFGEVFSIEDPITEIIEQEIKYL